MNLKLNRMLNLSSLMLLKVIRLGEGPFTLALECRGVLVQHGGEKVSEQRMLSPWQVKDQHSAGL